MHPVNMGRLALDDAGPGARARPRASRRCSRSTRSRSPGTRCASSGAAPRSAARSRCCSRRSGRPPTPRSPSCTPACPTGREYTQRAGIVVAAAGVPGHPPARAHHARVRSWSAAACATRAASCCPTSTSACEEVAGAITPRVGGVGPDHDRDAVPQRGRGRRAQPRADDASAAAVRRAREPRDRPGVAATCGVPARAAPRSAPTTCAAAALQHDARRARLVAAPSSPSAAHGPGADAGRRAASWRSTCVVAALASSPSAERATVRAMSSERHTIIYTHTDEAPALATRSLLPVVNAFTDVAGVQVELRDISLAGPGARHLPRGAHPRAAGRATTSPSSASW